MWPGAAVSSEPVIPVDTVETQAIDIREISPPAEPPKVEPSPERSSSERRESYQAVAKKDQEKEELDPESGPVPEKATEPPSTSKGKVEDQEKEEFTDEAGWMDVQGMNSLERGSW